MLANLAARIAMARQCPALPVWLAAGAAFALHGWAMRNGKLGVKVVTLRPGELAPVVVAAPPRKRRKSRWQPADLFDADSADGPTPDRRVPV